MTYQFKLPDIGEGIAEGEIIKWFVQPGQQVNEDDPLLEVQNDKSVEEIPSPVTGIVKKIIVAEGETAQVGDVLIELTTADQPEERDSENATQVVATAASANHFFEFVLPDIGEGIAEGEIIKWFVQPGEHIAEDDPLLEVQNDKSVEEIPSPVTGTIVKILVPEGTVAQVGDSLIQIDVPGYSTAATQLADQQASNKFASVAKSEPQLAGATSIVPANDQAENKQIAGDKRLVLALPSVRQYAREQNVNLAEVSPTGKHNRITKRDVEKFLLEQTTGQPEKIGGTGSAETQHSSEVSQAIAATQAKQIKSQPEGTTPKMQPTLFVREPMSATRKAIAKAMVTSKHSAPHVTLFDEVDVTKLVEHRARFKAVAADRDLKLTYLPYIVKALVVLLQKYPIFNAFLDEEAEEIVFKQFFNIGIATDTEQGLYVPNIKAAEQKSIFTLAAEIQAYTAKAHAGKLSGEDMRNGSMTISNIGSIGGGWFTPVINYPETAILGVGRIAKEAVVTAESEIVVAPIMKLSLSFDHRLIDGATAQKAMNELKRLLVDPELLLMEG